MADALVLYLRLIRGQVRTQLQYRVSFTLLLLGMAGLSFIDFAVILVFFRNVSALGGWSVPEVGFLFGVSMIAFSFADLILGHMDDVQLRIRDGSP